MLGAGHGVPGEGRGLGAIGRNGREARQDRLQPRCLGGRYGVGEDPRGGRGGGGKGLEGGGGQVGVDAPDGTALELRDHRGEPVRAEAIADGHVGEAANQGAVGCDDGGIGPGGAVGVVDQVSGVDTGSLEAGDEAIAGAVLADGAEEPDVGAEAAEGLGNVAGNTAGGGCADRRVRGRRLVGADEMQLAVIVGGADAGNGRHGVRSGHASTFSKARRGVMVAGTMNTAHSISRWLTVTKRGLYCEPGDFYIDPAAACDRAVVTHGHGDHARAGHGHVLATAATCAIMQHRYGSPGTRWQAAAHGETVRIGGVSVRLAPAGHILGSAQVVLEYHGERVVISGDYKRRPDPTCTPFEPVTCDVFITEATFGLPVFRHPPDSGEIARLLHSVALFPERCHLVGVYGLGKAQRVIALLRQAGYDAPLYIHGALAALCELYGDFGVDLGPLLPATGPDKATLKGQLVLAPPGARSEPWSRRLPDPLAAMASGWMGVRARARQQGTELPLVISDHADWDELTATLEDVDAGEVWVTHGREDALVHYAATQGRTARALRLVGRDEEAA